jgi:hypothetical protein
VKGKIKVIWILFISKSYSTAKAIKKLHKNFQANRYFQYLCR